MLERERESKREFVLGEIKTFKKTGESQQKSLHFKAK